MKTYITPELKEIAIVAQETIGTDGNLEGSNTFNDNTFKKWD